MTELRGRGSPVDKYTSALRQFRRDRLGEFGFHFAPPPLPETDRKCRISTEIRGPDPAVKSACFPTRRQELEITANGRFTDSETAGGFDTVQNLSPTQQPDHSLDSISFHIDTVAGKRHFASGKMIEQSLFLIVYKIFF